jgi:hypothetical protein
MNVQPKTGTFEIGPAPAPIDPGCASATSI